MIGYIDIIRLIYEFRIYFILLIQMNNNIFFLIKKMNKIIKNLRNFGGEKKIEIYIIVLYKYYNLAGILL